MLKSTASCLCEEAKSRRRNLLLPRHCNREAQPWREAIQESCGKNITRLLRHYVPRKDASFLRHSEEAKSRRGNLVPYFLGLLRRFAPRNDGGVGRASQ
jgi:hypothetical protein